MTAAFWHRLDGVFAAWGARVEKSRERGHASVFDVEPTVAALLDLPVDKHAPGRPMRAVFRDLPTPPRKDLAAEIVVNRLAAEPMSEKEAGEYAKQLMALGYLSGAGSGNLAPPGGDRPGLTEAAWNNLGLYLSSRGGAANLAAAVAAFQKSLELRPGFASPKLSLAETHRARGEDRDAIDLLFQAVAAGQASPERVVLDWAMDYDLKGKETEARRILERGAHLYPDDEPIHRAQALLFFKGKECRRADEALSRFETTTQEPQTLNTLALVRACLGRRDEAVALFHRSLALVPNQKMVLESLDVLQHGVASAR
jgi:Flp pilus assembly protein TadD